MGRLENRLDRAEKRSDYQRTTLVCPECGEEFDVLGDVALEVIVGQWLLGPEGTDLAKLALDDTPEDIRRLFDHGHPVGAFLDKASGLPFLSKAAGGFDLREVPESEASEAEDLSDP